jgi:hypothetical protein
MKRLDLIKSDDYLIATLECIITSGKPVKQSRKELIEFLIPFRDELLQSLTTLPEDKKAINLIDQTICPFCHLYLFNCKCLKSDKMTIEDFPESGENSTTMNKDQIPSEEFNPIEDQSKQALAHYEEASKAIYHWSSFVEAIKAYKPNSEQKVKECDASKADSSNQS